LGGETGEREKEKICKEHNSRNTKERRKLSQSGRKKRKGKYDDRWKWHAS
jgi:hypothetical protein